MSKNQEQLPNFMEKGETIVFLMVFEGVLYHSCTYTVVFSYHLLYINQVPEKLY